MPTPYSAKTVANFFLAKGQPTQMKLHKLLYYAHGWHLGFRGEALLDEAIEAWQYGPVVPSIYRHFRMFGADPIDRPATRFDPDQDSRVPMPPVDESEGFSFDLLERIWEVYGKFTASRLSALTHAANSPWTQARQGNPVAARVVIPNDLIREHFKQRVEQGANGS